MSWSLYLGTTVVPFIFSLIFSRKIQIQTKLAGHVVSVDGCPNRTLETFIQLGTIDSSKLEKVDI